MGVENQPISVQSVEKAEDTLSIDQQKLQKALENIRTSHDKHEHEVYKDQKAKLVQKAKELITVAVANFDKEVDETVLVGGESSLPFVKGEAYDADQAETHQGAIEVMEQELDAKKRLLAQRLNDLITSLTEEHLRYSTDLSTKLNEVLNIEGMDLQEVSLFGDAEFDPNQTHMVAENQPFNEDEYYKDAGGKNFIARDIAKTGVDNLKAAYSKYDNL